ncbi:MAG TPA: TOMM precursor leader peptide-binding protein [Jatrophihabitans sp.]|jgi:bacteriocin biosynthesis cyclodehydratase domain-containing protein|uniref:TOMM precursor leader peptide-binding protein n=1 Tax=Jatrophihabitans sp. TaxID=1932789 RepID=UPI002F094D56
MPSPSSPLANIRPRLRNDVVFLRVDTGIYLRSSQMSCVLKGQGVYDWMAALGPRMTGEWTVAELCEGLDEARRRTAEGLVRTLLDRGFARDAVASVDAELSEQVLRRFASQINFVEHFMHATDRSPQAWFSQFRSSRVLVLGPMTGITDAAVRGLLRNGLAEVSVTGGHTEADFAEDLAELAAAGTAAEVVSLPQTPHDVGDYDVVISAVDSAHSASLLELTRRVVGADRPSPRVLPVVIHDGRATLGPVCGPAELPCWVCAQLRLAANSDPRSTADFWRGLALGGPAAAEALDDPAATGGASLIAQRMIGNALAFEVFRLRTGQLGPQEENHAVVQDLTILESSRDRVLPHPQCPLPHAVPASAAEPLTQQETLARAGVLVSPKLGLLAGWTDETVKQIPVKTGRVRLGYPGSLAAGSRQIAAFDTDVILDARAQAVLAAVSTYIGRLGPLPGSGWHGEEGAGDGAEAPLIEARSLDTHSGTELPAGLRSLRSLPVTSMHGDGPRRAPAAAVYPFSAANADLEFEPTSAGSAAGWSVAEVQERGLCTALAFRAARSAIRAGAPLDRLADPALAADDESAFLLDSLRHLGRRPRVLVLPGAGPAFAVLVVIDGASPDEPGEWAIGSGLSPLAAVRTGLRQAVGAAMLRHYEGTPADLGDPLLGELDPRVFAEADPAPGGAASDTAYLDRPAVTVAEVLTGLAATGSQAYYADTTTLDCRSVGGLVAGAVLLAAR